MSNPDPSGADKRKDKRVSFAARVRLKVEGAEGMFRFFTKNLSASGMFIQTPKPLPVGRTFRLEVADPQGAVLFAANAVVARSQPPTADKSVVPGMGIQFVDMDAEAKRFVDRVIAANPGENIHPAPGESLFPESSVPEAPAAPFSSDDSGPLSTPPSGTQLGAGPERTPPSGTNLGSEQPEHTPPSGTPVQAPPPQGAAPPVDNGLGDVVDDLISVGEPEGFAADPGFPPISTGEIEALPDSAPAPVPATPAAEVSTPTPAPPVAPAPAPAAQAYPVAAPLPAINEQRYPPTSLVLGIDLGTTYSCAAVIQEGRPEIILSETGYRTIPSILSIREPDILVGWAAQDKMSTEPERTVYGAKRLLGRQYWSRTVQDALSYFKYPIVAGPGSQPAVLVDSYIYPIDWVSTRILYEIVTWAREHVKGHITKVVVAVPAYYNDRQRQVVVQAARGAGLEVLQIINEPTAAAIAYGIDRSLHETLLVYDLGGGTFDVSILSLQGNVFQVLATGGDAYLGGVDFDNRIVDWVLQQFMQTEGIDLTHDPVVRLRVREAAERAKRELSERNETKVHLPYVARRGNDAVNLNIMLTREQLEQLTVDLVQRTIDICMQTMQECGISPGLIDEVLLVGGQTRMPLVQAKVRSMTGRPPRKGIHPDEAVAVGAALLGDTISNVNRIALLDVCSMPIGVAGPGGTFRIVVEKNARLPVEKTFTVATSTDGQTTIAVDVFQGASSSITDNGYLGTAGLDGLPPLPAGTVFIQFVFKLDAQGFLTVSALDTATGQTRTVHMSTHDTPASVRDLHAAG